MFGPWLCICSHIDGVYRCDSYKRVVLQTEENDHRMTRRHCLPNLIIFYFQLLVHSWLMLATFAIQSHGPAFILLGLFTFLNRLLLCNSIDHFNASLLMLPRIPIHLPRIHVLSLHCAQNNRSVLKMLLRERGKVSIDQGVV